MIDLIRKYRALLPWCLMVTLLVMFIPWLGDSFFNTKGEPREALVALSMINSGNFILPESYGADIPYKPPMLAWLIVAASALTDSVNVFASRLPSAIAAIALGLMTFSFFRTRTRDLALGLLTAIITLTNVEVWRAATACRVDMVLTAATVIAIYALANARVRRRKPAFSFLAVLMMTVAVLTKGPVGMIIPCLVVAVWMLLQGDRFLSVAGWLSLQALLSLILPALWYWLAWQQGGDRFLNLALEENFGRMTGSMSYDSHLNPWWYNILTLLAGLLPYTLLLLLSLFSVKYSAKKSSINRIVKQFSQLPDASRLSIVAVAVIFIFYCFPASKRSVYLLPLYPFASFLIAKLALWLANRNARSLSVYSAIIASLALIVAWLVWAMHMLDIPQLIPGLKGDIANLADGLFAASWNWIQWTLIFLTILTASWTILKLRASGKPLLAATLITTVTLLTLLPAVVLPPILNAKSDIVVAQYVNDRLGAKNVLTFNAAPMMRWFTVAFYTNDQLRLFAPEENSSQSKNLQSQAPLPDQGFLLVNNRDLPLWKEKYGTLYDIDTLKTFSHRSGDTRALPIILRFSRTQVAP